MSCQAEHGKRLKMRCIAFCQEAYLLYKTIYWLTTNLSSTWMFTQMILALIVVAVTLAIAGAKTWVAWFILVFICIYIAAYAW